MKSKKTNHEISEASRAERKFDRDLKSCMKCHYFWGNDSRCMNSKCYKEKKKEEKPVEKEVSECTNCPYKQSNSYCFPCMKKIMEKKADEDVEQTKTD